MKVKFTTPLMGVLIEPDRLAMHTVYPDCTVISNESIDIPMIYCEMGARIEGDIGGDGDACTAVLLDIRGRTLYLDDEAPSRITVKVRDVEKDTWQDDFLHCRCNNADLCIGVLEILGAIDYLDDGYLSAHGDDMDVIRNVSRTACLTARARAIVDRRYAGPGSAYRYEKLRERRER